MFVEYSCLTIKITITIVYINSSNFLLYVRTIYWHSYPRNSVRIIYYLFKIYKYIVKYDSQFKSSLFFRENLFFQIAIYLYPRMFDPAYGHRSMMLVKTVLKTLLQGNRWDEGWISVEYRKTFWASSSLSSTNFFRLIPQKKKKKETPIKTI